MRSCSRRLWALLEEEGGGSNLRSIATTTSFLRFRSFFGIFLRHVYFLPSLSLLGGPRSKESACERHLRRRPCSTRWRARQSRPTGCVTERSTHVLGDAPEQPAPALLCALAPHLAQFDRVGGLVGTQAMSLHPRAAVVPWLREPAVTARSRVRAWRRLGGRPWCRRR